MSNLYDTLEYNGTERTFAGWGFALQPAPKTKRRNLQADTFTATVAGANIADDPIFPYEAFVKVRTNRVSADGSDNSFSVGTIKFQGKRVQNVLQAAAARQGVSYEFQGPWYDLDITQYLQTFKGQTTNYNPGENVLNTAAYPLISSGGLRFISVGDQIQCVLQFVLDSYAALSLAAPFQYVGRDLTTGAINLNTSGTAAISENTDAGGNAYIKHVNATPTIDVSLFKLFLKSEIIRPMSATQVIQKLLEWSPRTNMAFDYSTTPPTVYFINMGNAADVNLALFDGTNHKSINLQRRDDLVPAAIVIGYRITNTVGGTTGIDYAIDKYGPHGSNSGSDPGAGPGVVVLILDLQGFSISFATGSLNCEPLACIGGSHATRRDWWASKKGGELAKLEDARARFQDESGAATTIPNAKIYYAAAGLDSTGTAVAANQEFTSADYSFFVNRLLGTGVAPWMLVSGVPVKSVKVKIVAPMQFAEYDATGSSETDTTGNVIHRHNATDQEHVNCELTNGVTDDYSAVASSSAGELYTLGAGGIAQYLWNMLSTRQYEGEFVKVEASFTSGVSLLNAANLTGGRTEWTTMHAQIQEIEEDWGTKETSIRIGIAKHLSADQLSALLNMCRFRRAWFSANLKADNTVAAGGEIQIPDAAGQANTVEGLKLPQKQAQTFYTTLPTGSTPGVIGGQLNHDPKLIKDALAATTPTAVTPFVTADLKVMQPREVAFCDEAGNKVFGVAHITGFYTKS